MITQDPPEGSHRGWPTPEIVVIVVVLAIRAGYSASQVRDLIGTVTASLIVLALVPMVLRRPMVAPLTFGGVISQVASERAEWPRVIHKRPN